MALSTHGISGSAAPAQLETALQLLYAKFTQPGDDPEAFDLLKRQLTAAVANRLDNPSAVFGDKLSAVNTSNLIDRTRSAGAIFAVAGQLRPGELRRVPADVVGVRSAVCRAGDRASDLQAELVAAAVAELRAGTGGQPGTIRVPASGAAPGSRTRTATPVRRTASDR